MLGLAFANPAVLMATIKYKTYVPHFVQGADAQDIDAAKKFMKRVATDSRRRVFLVHGRKALDNLWRAQLDGVLDLSTVILAVFDAAETLAASKDLKIVDADLEVQTSEDRKHYTYRIHKYDPDQILADAEPGFPATSMVVDQPIKIVESSAVLRPTTVAQEKRLADLFDPILAEIESAKKRTAAGQWVAAKLEGLLGPTEWANALKIMKKNGLDVVALTNGVESLKPSGQAKKFLAVASAVIEGSKTIEEAVTATGANASDIAWLHEKWPLAKADEINQQESASA